MELMSIRFVPCIFIFWWWMHDDHNDDDVIVVVDGVNVVMKMKLMNVNCVGQMPIVNDIYVLVSPVAQGIIQP